MEIKVNYHSSVLIDDRIFVDPLKVDGKLKADFVFITHPHWDHFSIPDVQKVYTTKTVIVCPKSMQNEIEDKFDCQIVYVDPGQKYEINGLKFETFLSYNTNKKFHPKENLWVGYNFDINGTKVAVVGDCDITPELEKLKTDILLVPIGGTYTMDYMEAAKLTNLIKPKIVIPTHYGKIVGDVSFGNKFKNLLDKDIKCDLQI